MLLDHYLTFATRYENLFKLMMTSLMTSQLLLSHVQGFNELPSAAAAEVFERESSGGNLDNVHHKDNHVLKSKEEKRLEKIGRLNTSDVVDMEDSWITDESKLIEELMRRYRRNSVTSRPLINSSHNITVEFSIALIQILSLDERNQVLTTNVWKRYRWTDQLLVWDPERYGNVTDIRLDSRSVWTPDIVLYNNAADQDKTHEELLSVYHNGLVLWTPAAIYKSSCIIDMRNFPFDVQRCHFKFGSWTHDGNKLNLKFYDNLPDMDRREYVDSSEWEVLLTEAEHHIKFYPCCGDEPYPDLTFYVTLRRKTGFYIFVLVLPSLMLSFLTLVIFCIPPHRPDRTTLGMSLFSSFFVLLLILVQSSPPSSASLSLLGIYYSINMVIIALSTMLSSIVINVVDGPHTSPVPFFINILFLKVLSRIFCAYRTPTEKSSAEGWESHSKRYSFSEQNGDNHTVTSSECNKTIIVTNNGSESFVRGVDTEICLSGNIPLDAPTKSSSRAYCRKSMSRNGSLINKRMKHPKRLAMEDYKEDWRLVAIVMDRFFFVVFLIGICLSIALVFPQENK